MSMLRRLNKVAGFEDEYYVGKIFEFLFRRPEGPWLIWAGHNPGYLTFHIHPFCNLSETCHPNIYGISVLHDNSPNAPLKRARPRPHTIALLLQLRKPGRLAVRVAARVGVAVLVPAAVVHIHPGVIHLLQPVVQEGLRPGPRLVGAAFHEAVPGILEAGFGVSIVLFRYRAFQAIKGGGDAIALFLENVLRRAFLVVFPGGDDVSHFLECFVVVGIVVDVLSHLIIVDELLAAPHLHVK